MFGLHSSRAGRRRLMRWGGQQRLPHFLQHRETVAEYLAVPKARCSASLLPQKISRALLGGALFRLASGEEPRTSLKVPQHESIRQLLSGARPAADGWFWGHLPNRCRMAVSSRRLADYSGCSGTKVAWKRAWVARPGPSGIRLRELTRSRRDRHAESGPLQPGDSGGIWR